MSHISFQIITAGKFDSLVKYGNVKATPYRFVYDYEFELYEDGDGVSSINGVEYPMRRGNIIIGKPGDVRSSSLPMRCRYIHLRVDGDDLKEFLNELPSIVHTEEQERYTALFDAVTDHFFVGKQKTDILAGSDMLTLIYSLYNTCISSDKHKVSTGTEDIVLHAQQYIEDHYSEDLSIDDLAKYCHVSISYLHKLFMKVMNESPHQVILNRRLTAAKTLIVNESLSMSEVAKRAGFNSQAYFSDCFKRITGMSPVDYRKYAAHQP